jgi:hypothetical protein
MLVALALVAANPVGVLGGVASGGGGQGLVDAVSEAFEERLPAASKASTANE